MGGKVLEYEAKTIRNEGRIEGTVSITRTRTGKRQG